MQLTTERLIIRDVKLSDLERFYSLGNSEFVLKYLCMEKMNYEESRNYILQMIEKKKDFIIALKDSDELIGKIHIDNDNLRFDVNSISLSYWLGEEYTRQGYMTEALNEFIDYLFNVKNYDIISAEVLAPNIASLALVKGLGFTHEGYLRRALKYNDIIYDNVVFSLEKTEFVRKIGYLDGKCGATVYASS